MFGYLEILSFFGFDTEAAQNYIDENKKGDFPQSVIDEVLEEAGLD